MKIPKATHLDLSCNLLITVEVSHVVVWFGYLWLHKYVFLLAQSNEQFMSDVTIRWHLTMDCFWLTVSIVMFSFQPEFPVLTHLVRLDLSKNKIKSLPPNFGDLTKLQVRSLRSPNKLLFRITVPFRYLTFISWPLNYVCCNSTAVILKDC